MCAGVCGYAWVCTGVRGYARVCAYVWDEFSEFFLENRVPTLADFNTYPIRIFLGSSNSMIGLYLCCKCSHKDLSQRSLTV